MVKYTHACVRLEQDRRTLVIDPGVWSEGEALDGVSDVLVTHEHYDHLDVERLTAAVRDNADLKIYTNAAVAAQLADLGDAVVPVTPGDTFTVAGFDVRVVGGAHAEIYEGLPGCANVGYVVEGLYHPGDALFVPDAPVDTLLVPTHAPWSKLAEVLDFVRAVKPRRAHSIHDAMLSPIGQENVDRWLALRGETEYARVAVGESVSL